MQPSNPPDDTQAQELLDAFLRELQAGRKPDRDAVLKQRPDLLSVLDCLTSLENLAPPPQGDIATLAPATPMHVSTGSGQRIGKFAIIRELGRGGMGVVYLAQDTELNRPVALKMILAGSMASDEYLQRFQAEVRASARLDHEGIARVYDSGAFNGLPYLAMQFVEGPSLAQYLRSHHPDSNWSVRCVIQLARTVAYFHSQGIVHRDLKPANILLAHSEISRRKEPGTFDGQNDPSFIPNPSTSPKITDFGVAKLLEEEGAATRSGAIVGTPNYMAPEQARGESRSVGPPADVHALGAILYELLVGQPPFARETSMATLLEVMGSEPVPPRRRKPTIHPDLDAICLKCLEKAPESRFASASELADALERHLRGEDVPQARLSPLQSVSRWLRRNPALASRLAILIGCVLILYSRSAVTGGVQFGKTFAVVSLKHLTLIFAVWISLSWLFQRLLRRSWGETVIPYIWAVVDVGILTAILVLTDSLVSPIDIGFPLLVAASGLWLSESLVWFTFGCAVVGYGGGTILMYVNGFNEQLHRHVIFLAGLLTLSFLVLHFVQRFRALSRYYEGK